MKKLHKLLIGAFIPPFLASFSVSLFILVLEFLARYQEDIFGKGFPAWVIVKLFWYASGSMVVMAIPIAVLLASLMTLGKLGEFYELVAIKAAGISLFKFLRPLWGIGLLLGAFSFWFAAEVIPKANLKLYSLLYDVERAKPKFKLKSGIFNYTIDHYVIRAAKAYPDGTLKNVMIYDYSNSLQNLTVVIADSGRIHSDYQKMYLYFWLYRGYRFSEHVEHPRPGETYPHSRLYFDSLLFRFDLSGFGLQRSDEQLFASHHYMLTLNELRKAADSISHEPQKLKKEFHTYLYNTFLLKNLPKSLKEVGKDQERFCLALLEAGYNDQRVLINVQNHLRGIKSFVEFYEVRYKDRVEMARKYWLTYYHKWMIPLATLVFLLIGAPLGAIIRKGGIGAPTVVSVSFFVVFYVLMTQGKKLAREGVLDPWTGAFLPVLIIGPIAIYILYQAANDARLLENPLYPLKQWFKKSESKNPQ